MTFAINEDANVLRGQKYDKIVNDNIQTTWYNDLLLISSHDNASFPFHYPLFFISKARKRTASPREGNPNMREENVSD